MTLILDAAPLVALADAKEPRLEALLRVRKEEDGPLVLPAPVAAEVDYLLGVRFGHAARVPFSPISPLGPTTSPAWKLATIRSSLSSTPATPISTSASPIARSWFLPSGTEPGASSASTSAIFELSALAGRGVRASAH